MSQHPGTQAQTAVSSVGGRDGKGERAMVPRDEPRSYYGRPVIAEPVWTWEIPWYFFSGGLAGASAGLAFGAGALGNERLARRAWPISLAAVGASPALLIADLGRPERFLNMLRVFKVTSPMSMGSWLLVASGPCTVLATAHSLFGWFPRAGRLGKLGAAVLGPGIATYTAALISNTSVPVWHEARAELPFVFAGSAMGSAGAAVAAVTPVAHAGPARRLAVLGAALEAAASGVMEHRLGELGEPYHGGEAARFARPAKALTVLGGAILARKGHRRAGAVLGAAAILAGAVLQRWAIFKAGFESARDPKYTVGPQRRRLRERGAG